MLSTDFVPGIPNWIDLGAPDVDAAAAFYGRGFGWDFESAGPQAGGYGFFKVDGRTVAAVGPLQGEGASPSWNVYFHTPDADGLTKLVEQAGGTVRMQPMDIFDSGRTAAFTDPTGAEFAVWQGRDLGGLGVVNEPNTLSWVELYTTDSAAATAFYRSVFRWQAVDFPMGEGMNYTVVSPEGATGENTGHGGIMQLQQENLDAGNTSEWHPYFEVTDPDATFAVLSEAGATAMVPPTTAPGVGRFAMLADPFGAPFAIIRGETPS